MMDMKRKTNRTMDPICEACSDSAGCDVQETKPQFPERIPDGLLELYLVMRSFELIAEILRHFEPEPEDEEDPDDEKIVIQLFGAEAPEVLTCDEIGLNYGDFVDEFETLDDFMGEGLTLYYDPDEVERFGGKMYLTGAAVVCYRDEDGEFCSLDGEDIYHTLRWAERQRVILSRNGEKIPALRIN